MLLATDMNNISEDDTFNALKRVSFRYVIDMFRWPNETFEEAYKALEPYFSPNRVHDDTIDFDSVAIGWTWKEFVIEFAKNNPNTK